MIISFKSAGGDPELVDVFLWSEAAGKLVITTRDIGASVYMTISLARNKTSIGSSADREREAREVHAAAVEAMTEAGDTWATYESGAKNPVLRPIEKFQAIANDPVAAA